MRIVSFLPSATEILYALKVGDSVLGVSHECDYPPRVRRKPVVMKANLPSKPLSDRQIDRRVRKALRSGNGLYYIDTPLLEKIKPDLIVTQKLCDVCAVSSDAVEEVVRHFSPKPTVFSLHPHSLAGVFDDIVKLGERVGKYGAARRYVTHLKQRVLRVQGKVKGLKRPRVFSMEWCDPIMNAGHWIPEMVEIAGGVEGLSEKGEPSKRIPWGEVRRYQPEILFLMPCGFSMHQTFQRVKHLKQLPGWRDLPAVRRDQVYCLDGSSYYNRPGPRLIDGLEIMAKLIHPEKFRSLHLKKDAVRCL